MAAIQIRSGASAIDRRSIRSMGFGAAGSLVVITTYLRGGAQQIRYLRIGLAKRLRPMWMPWTSASCA